MLLLEGPMVGSSRMFAEGVHQMLCDLRDREIFGILPVEQDSRDTLRIAVG